jgi:integrase
VHDTARSDAEKKHNSEQERLAELIRQKRENALNKPEIYTEYEKQQLKLRELGQADFVDYMRRQANRRQSKSNRIIWLSALHFFSEFSGGSLKFSELSEMLLDEFRDYLLSTTAKRSKNLLSQNTAHLYYGKVKAALRQAFRDGIIQTDLSGRLKSIEAVETERAFLDPDELNRLAKTPCDDELIKRAALFSALTGLRFCDIKKLVWDEVFYIEGQGHYLRFRQKKTMGFEIHPIGDQAIQLCGERGDPKQLVFQGMKYSAYYRKRLMRWIKDADITKHVPFHGFRHTYGTLQHFYGTSPATLQKLMGHKNLKQTMVYTKITDPAKRAAADKIVLDM